MTVEELEIVIRANVTDAMKGIETVTKAVRKAVTESVKPMEQMAVKTKTIANKSSNNFKTMINSVKNVKKSLASTTAQQQLLINKIERYKKTLATEDSLPRNLRMSDSEALKLQADIEKLQAELNGLQSAGAKSSTAISDGFKKSKKSLKRFTLGLLSVRSAISLISKAMRSYMATNDEANKKYQITTNILGQTLAPAMEKLLDLVQYLTIGVALLIEMFTGFNALANVTTSDLQDATDSAKDLNKELTAMDEITNLSDDSNTSSSLASDYAALLDFQKKIQEVRDLFQQWKVDDFVEDIKKLSKWLWDNRDAVVAVGVALGIVFGALNITSMLANISALMGTAGAGAAGVGLAGLGTAILWVAGIAAAGILLYITVKGLSEALSDLGKLKEALSNNKSIAEKLKELTGLTISTVGGAVRSGDYDPTAYAEKLQSSITRQVQMIEGLEKSKTIFNIRSWSGIDGTISDLNSQITDMRKELNALGYGQYAVPEFATGGVLKEPTYGLMGEYAGAKSNPEIVSPQSIMKETIMDAFSQILPSMQGSNGGGEAVININGQELARATFNDFQNETNRRNTSTSISVS